MKDQTGNAIFKALLRFEMLKAAVGLAIFVVLLVVMAFGYAATHAGATMATSLTMAFVGLNGLGLVVLVLLNILPRPTRSTIQIRAVLRTFFTYEALTLVALLMLVPFYWMVVTSFKDGETASAFAVRPRGGDAAPAPKPGELTYEQQLKAMWTPSRRVYLWTNPETNEQQEVRLLGVQRREGELVPAVPAEAMEFRAVAMSGFTITREEPAEGAPRLQLDPRTLPNDIVTRLDPRNFLTAWYAPEAATRGVVNFGRYFFVSIFTGILCTLGTLFTSALAAYAFARMRFVGKEYFFYLVLVTMMVPGQVLLIPNFLTLSRLGWLDTYAALVVPYLASVFTIFMMRQFFLTIPEDLWEAAQIDGAGRFRFLWQVVVPLSKPVFVTAGIFLFLGNWNALLWPLIVTSSPQMRTLMVGLQAFSEESQGQFHLLMAASAMAIAPVVVLFFVLQRFFIQGIARTGLK